MIPRSPTSLTNETLTPTKLNAGFNRLYQDLLASTNKRFCYSSFELNFSALASTHATEDFKYYIKPPFAWEVVAVELFLYEPTGTVTNVALSSTLTGWETVNAVPLGATTKVVTGDNFTAKGAALTEQTFTLTVTAGGAYALDRCYAVIHIRADRGNSGDTYNSLQLDDAPRWAAGEAVAAAKVNTGFTNYQTAVTRNTAADKQLRIQVFSIRDIAVALATSDRDLVIPSTGSRFHSYDVVNNGAVGDNLVFTLIDEVAATVSTTTVNGGTPPQKTQSVTCTDTQTNSDPFFVGNDYILRFTRAGAVIIPLGYVVVYYT